MREKFRVVFAGRSVQDLEDIAPYLAERSGGPWFGEIWLDSILEHIERLEQFPFGYPEFCVAPYRKLFHGRYLVIFRIDELSGEVFVVRVIHGMRLGENVGPLKSE